MFDRRSHSPHPTRAIFSFATFGHSCIRGDDLLVFNFIRYARAPLIKFQTCSRTVDVITPTIKVFWHSLNCIRGGFPLENQGKSPCSLFARLNIFVSMFDHQTRYTCAFGRWHFVAFGRLRQRPAPPSLARYNAFAD